MAAVDELKEKLEKLRDSLKTITEGRVKHPTNAGYYLNSFSLLSALLSKEEFMTIPDVQKTLKETLFYMHGYSSVLDEFISEAADRGEESTLVDVHSGITVTLGYIENIRTRIDALKSSDPAFGDAAKIADELPKVMSSLSKKLADYVDSLRKDREKTEEGRKRREEEEKAEAVYEYDWYIFYDAGEKKRCMKKKVLPKDIIDIDKATGKPKAIRIPGGKAGKRQEFMTPSERSRGVPAKAFIDAEAIGLAVKLLPSVGAEASIDFVTRTSRRKWRWAFVEKDRFPREIRPVAHPDRKIEGKVVSKVMLDYLGIDPNSISGKQINEMGGKHLSPGINGAEVTFTHIDPAEGEKPIDDLEGKTDERGDFKFSFKGAVPNIITHSKKDGRESKHTDTPWGRGGNPHKDNPLPTAPINRAFEENVVVALDLYPNFSKEFVGELWKLVAELKKYKTHLTFIEGSNYAKIKQVFENVVEKGPDIMKKIEEVIKTIRKMLKDDKSGIVRKHVEEEITKIPTTAELMKTKMILSDKDLSKKIIKKAAVDSGHAFAFDESTGKFGPVSSFTTPVLDKLKNESYPHLKEIYKYYVRYLTIFTKLNPGLKGGSI